MLNTYRKYLSTVLCGFYCNMMIDGSQLNKKGWFCFDALDTLVLSEKMPEADIVSKRFASANKFWCTRSPALRLSHSTSQFEC